MCAHSKLEPGGWISWGEYDYSHWDIIRTPAADRSADVLTELLDWTGTMGKTTESWVRNYWPARLPITFEEQGLINIYEDHRPLPNELLAFQLDTALQACTEISYKAMDQMGGDRGLKTRNLIRKVFENRSNTAFNVHRLTVVGQKPIGKT